MSLSQQQSNPTEAISQEKYPQIYPPLTGFKDSYSFRILRDILFQLAGAAEQNPANQNNLLWAMYTIGSPVQYKEVSTEDGKHVFGHPDAIDDTSRQITYNYKDGKCHIDYAANANAQIWVLPAANENLQIHSIHNSHFHTKGKAREDVALAAPRKKCETEAPTLAPKVTAMDNISSQKQQGMQAAF